MSVYQGTILEGEGTLSKVYKRRFLGMAQLFLLNICASIAWIDLAPIVEFAAEHFGTSAPAINWFSTSFLLVALLANYPASRVARRGLKLAMLVSSVLMVAGTWLMYGGTWIRSFGLALFGHSIIAMAQPFTVILPAPYSEAWFRSGSRATATAISGLATILGTTIGQFIIPAWVKSADEVTQGILYQSILLSAAGFLTLFIPGTPPRSPGLATMHERSMSHIQEAKTLFSRTEIYLAGIPFGVLTGVFNALSFLIFQICMPYGFTVDQCSIAGLLMALPGLILAVIAGRLADMFRCHVILLKGMALVTGAGILAFAWVPPSGSVGFLYAVSTVISIGVIGPSGVAVEFVAEFIYPLGPELAIALMWGVGQLLGAALTIGCGYMTDKNGGIQPGVYLLVGLGVAVLPFTLSLGLWGRRMFVQLRRTEAESNLQTAS
ncbi:major facilitator superfamily domain-containing protein [Ilyonectria destructans]|nr:major facilitator superfamily domain-containing protein [Ilyonectria destructans]